MEPLQSPRQLNPLAWGRALASGDAAEVYKRTALSGGESTTNLADKYRQAQAGVQYLKNHGTPEELAAAQQTMSKLDTAMSTCNDSHTTGNAPTFTGWGGDVSNLSKATQSPAATQAFVQHGLQDPAQQAAFETAKSQPMDVPLHASSAVSDAIPAWNKFKMWAGDNPMTTMGLGLGGGALLTMLLSRLFSGGQQQAPQVAYQQPAQMPPQRPSTGSWYNINNLMG